MLPFYIIPHLLPCNLRQSLPAAGIIEESESARGERGKVGEGRVGFRVQARARWEKVLLWQPLVKKMVFDDENVFRVPKPDLMKLRSSLACCVLDRTDGAIVSISRSIRKLIDRTARVS